MDVHGVWCTLCVATWLLAILHTTAILYHDGRVGTVFTALTPDGNEPKPELNIVLIRHYSDG